MPGIDGILLNEFEEIDSDRRTRPATTLIINTRCLLGYGRSIGGVHRGSNYSNPRAILYGKTQLLL